MTPEQVPAGPLLVDTDVVSWLMLEKGRVDEFAPLVEGHLLAIGFPTYGEVLALGHKKGFGNKKLDAEPPEALLEHLHAVLDLALVRLSPGANGRPAATPTVDPPPVYFAATPPGPPRPTGFFPHQDFPSWARVKRRGRPRTPLG